MREETILSPSQVSGYIKSWMDRDRLLSGLLVRGELSNYKMYPSGHHYFTLKDSQGALRCVMFRGDAASLRFRPENGMQVIAAAQGGGLIQDLPPEQCVFHKGTKRDDARHPVRTMPGSLLERLYGPILHTNSFHHQAVADPGFGMVITAWSEGGVAEAMEHQRLPILGVQFHPERMAYTRRRPDCDDGGAIWEYFLKQCNEYK